MSKVYIERKALLQDIVETVIFSTKTGERNSEIKGARKVIGRIQAIPTADVVEVRHGKWVYINRDLNYVDCKCSECDYIDTFVNDTDFFDNYCPNCGAKMDKE